MKDEQASTGPDWSAVWADMQRKYWETWAQLMQPMTTAKSGEAPESPADPWSQGLDFWTRLMTGAMPEEPRASTQKLLDLNKSYLQFGKMLVETVSAGRPGGGDPGQWWEALSRNLAALQQPATGVGTATDPWGGLATLWGLPLDTWKRLASACSMMPGDVEKAFRDLGGSQETAFGSVVGHWLSTPTLGYTRESQEEAQCLARLWLDHTKAAYEFTAVLSRVVSQAGDLLREKILALMREGKQVESLRACYDLWVDCGEEAYAEVSRSDEFTRAQAKLTNTLMAVKRQEQKMVDEVLGALNMPTRRELDTSHRRVHQLQRRVWQMEEVLDDASVGELRREVAALQGQVAELTRTLDRTATPPAARARRSTRSNNAT